MGYEYLQAVYNSLIRKGVSPEYAKEMAIDYAEGVSEWTVAPDVTSMYKDSDGNMRFLIGGQQNYPGSKMAYKEYSVGPTHVKGWARSFIPTRIYSKDKYGKSMPTGEIDTESWQRRINAATGDSTYVANPDGTISRMLSTGQTIDSLADGAMPMDETGSESAVNASSMAYGGRLFAQGGRIKVKPAPNTIRSRNGLKMRRADDLGSADYDIYF